MEISVDPATQEDIDFVAEHARDDDRIEAYSQTGHEITYALNLTYAMSSVSWCGKVNGKPVVVFGVTPDGVFGESANPWMIGTDEIIRYQVPFLRRCCYYVNIMQRDFPYLHNYVDERNTVAKRWLKWMGFEIGEVEPHGPFGDAFRYFKMGEPQ